MQKIDFNRDWEFCEETPALFFPMQGMSGKKTVNLPHDIDICKTSDKECPEGHCIGYLRGHYGMYTKFFDVPEEWKGKRVFLNLDGAYCNTEITLSGHLMGIHPNGYCPYTVELTERLLYGKKNRLAIFVNNSAQRSARWYSGSGIYRKVSLYVGDPVHICVDGIFAHTDKIEDGEAQITVETEIANTLGIEKEIRVLAEICEDNGRNTPDGAVVAQGESVIAVKAENTKVCKLKIILKNAKLWDLGKPNLYRVKVALYEKSEKLDEGTALFGVRTLSADVKHGLRLNGKTVKIKGGCVHHDNGILGAKSFYDSEYRRLKILKDNGFNGIRAAHNPMSSDMLEACDRLGLLMFAEAFDVWNMGKNVNDYHLYFADWWERDLTAFVKRDRNHPCIFCWSIGNEVGERNSMQGGKELAQKLSHKVRELDKTRFVTSAVPTMFNGMDDEDTVCQLMAMQKLGGYTQNLSTPWSQEHWAERTKDFCAPLDIVGYNYLEMRYERDSKEFPERIMCGTESYPFKVIENVEAVERNDNVIGDFVWTAQDFLGETGLGNIRYVDKNDKPVMQGELRAPIYPHRTAGIGHIDINGYERPVMAYRRIVWGSDETYIAVQNPANYGKVSYRSNWAWDDCDNAWLWKGYENKPIEVEVYSAAEEVELIVNGKSLGRVQAGRANKYRAKFDAVYQAGEITAISYTGGKEISRQTLITPSEACDIKLTADRAEIAADGQSLAFIDVEVLDKDGNLVTDQNVTMTACASGAGELAAFGSSATATEENYTEGKFTSNKGRLLAIIRSGYETGTAALKVKSPFGEKEITIKVI